MKENLEGSIPHNRPTFGREEEKAAIRVIRSKWVAQGKEVELFENEVCEFLGLPSGHAIAVSSGTAALCIALIALAGRNRNIAIPVYACSALRNAVAMVRGSEVLVDTAPSSPNIDVKELEKINHNIAIIPHMFGFPVDISKINNSIFIEDCAQSLGAKINGISTGLHGKIGIFSFYASKLITSGGQGGMLASRDLSLIDQIRDYREFDLRHDKKTRFNFQMTDLQAAIGREQLKKFPYFVQRREEIFSIYKGAGLKMLDVHDKDSTPVRYRAVLRTDKPGRIINHLKRANIKCIIPVEGWELLGHPESFPNALRLAEETVSLPIYPSLKDEEANKIAQEVLKT